MLKDPLVLGIIGSLVAGVILWLIFGGPSQESYKVKSKNQTGGITAGKIVQEFKTFSDSQSIKTLPPSLGGVKRLNLNNLATLKLDVPYSEESVTLALDVVTKEFPDFKDETIQVEGVQIFNSNTSSKYVFDMSGNKRNEISVLDKKFVVTLVSIKKLDVPNVGNPIEYKFNISEIN